MSANEQTLALQESEERFRATFEQAAVGIAHVATDGKWLMVNQKLYELLGYTREELLERTFQDITYPEDLDTYMEYVRQMLADEIQTYSMEKRYIRKGGSPIWINLTVSLVRETLLPGQATQKDKPKYFIAVIENIAGRKQAEEALNRSSQRLETLQQIDRAILAADSLPKIVHAALSRIARLVLAEQSFVVLFDFENSIARIIAEKLTGDWQVLENATMPLTDFIPTQVLEQNRENASVSNFYLDYPPILQRQQAAEMGSYICIPMFTKDNIIGEVILASDRRGAFNTEHLQIVSEVANQIAIAMQQTQLREQLEQRVAERTAQLQEANTELEAFAYSISHDLRAPLRNMQGFSQALLEDYAEQMDSTAQEYAHRIIRAGERMETLIEELLAYSRLSRAEIQLDPLNLASIVADALAQVDEYFRERQVKIKVDKPLLQVQVLAQRSILIQVIINLLTNAAKFITSGVQPQLRVWAEHSHEVIRLWVEDNGIGIAVEKQERIFAVFERLHGIETYPGTGIGLAIVRKGVEHMGGRVGVESEVSKGSRFWIELSTKR